MKTPVCRNNCTLCSTVPPTSTSPSYPSVDSTIYTTPGASNTRYTAKQKRRAYPFRLSTRLRREVPSRCRSVPRSRPTCHLPRHATASDLCRLASRGASVVSRSGFGKDTVTWHLGPSHVWDWETCMLYKELQISYLPSMLSAASSLQAPDPKAPQFLIIQGSSASLAIPRLH